MDFIHSNLANGRWSVMTLAEQMANVGSEFERALQWKKKNNSQFFDNAAARMLDLMDLTISDKRWHNHRLKELTRIREVVCEELFNESPNQKSIEGLEKYFLSFGYLARLNK
ncbi:MAG: hypothetical protein PHE59_01210 [Patescibacteria group bacterium]|nr:hypothetical protein [Patescibacteria group bacterium]MDD5164290.1 hypothetical protein [Patescibacteria group bacterium]MDD5535029.1 hypothetical protein [Patescibacteria group bacterium]